MHWINSTDLQRWAPQRDCQGYLSLVIRRLIQATAKDISDISFPAGDSVQYAGWDGNLRSNIGTEYIPQGHSVWEIGTNAKIKEKAERDYRKRTEDTDIAIRRSSIFVFATPRIWTGKDEWRDQKSVKNEWLEIRVYDGRDLEEWLEQAPPVGAWLAKYLRIIPNENLESAEDFWREWTISTEPHLTADLVLSGRDYEVQKIKNWLNSPPESFAVQASTKEESLAFLLAVANKMPEMDRQYFYSRCLIANSLDAFRYVNTTKSALIMVANFNEVEFIKAAIQNKHHVYIPVDPSNIITNEKLILPRLKRELLIDALKKMGVAETDAQTHSRESGRSLTVLKRRLSGINSRPEWAGQNTARDIIPALLVGRWKENKEPDRSVVAAIAREDYQEIAAKLGGWLLKPDCPFYKIGESWRLTSPMDAWFALAPYITSEDLRNFEKIFMDVLGANNPMYDLEPGKRYAASLYGKEMPYSEWLREGIAQTLILIVVFGEDSGLNAVGSPQAWVDGEVGKLLEQADWKKWSSLSDVLPQVAEASPSSFLNAVELSLSEENPQVMGMFSDKDDDIFSSSAHTGLLWALEGLAWDPTLLGRVSLVLAKLAKLDRGGKLANRPSNSLREIFLLWHRNTYSTPEQKLSVLDMLLERENDVGWKLLVSLVPSAHEFSSPTHRCRWRQAGSSEIKELTNQEIFEVRNTVIGKILNHAKGQGERWAEIIERLRDFPQDRRLETTRMLAADSTMLNIGREALRSALRRFLSRHRSYPDAKWALPETELLDLEAIYKTLDPSDIQDRYVWLFDSRPELPEGYDGMDYQKRESIINERRDDACRAVKEKLGIEGIVSMVESVKDSWALGLCAAQLDLDLSEEVKLFSVLDINKSENSIRLAQGYIRKCAIDKGNDWIDNIIKLCKEEYWPESKVVSFLIALPENISTWGKMESFAPNIENEFWRKCWGRFIHTPAEEREYGIKKRLAVNRIYTALNIANINSDGLPATLIFELLQRAAVTPPEAEANLSIDAYDIGRLLQVLDEASEITELQKVQLEWAYLPIISDGIAGYTPKRLHNELATNPSFFAEIIKFIYKPRDSEFKDNPEGLAQEALVNRARRANDLLSSWKIIPGTVSDGSISYEALKKWVMEARQLCKDSGRDAIGDEHIGQILALVEKDENDSWPPGPICQIIDETESKDIETGFHVGISNKRGVVTRALDEGGIQERALAQYYRDCSDRIISRWPRTAAVLLNIAVSYEEQAKNEDKEADQRDLEY